MNDMDEEIVQGSKREQFILIVLIALGLLSYFGADYFAQILFSKEISILDSNPDLALENMELKLNIFLILTSLGFGLMFFYFIKHGVYTFVTNQFPPKGMSVPFDTKLKKGKSAIASGALMIVFSIIPLLYIGGAIWVWINI